MPTWKLNQDSLVKSLLIPTPQDTVTVILMRNRIEFGSTVAQFSTGMLTFARPVLFVCDYTKVFSCALVASLKSER